MRLGVLLPHRAAVLQSARRPPVEECWTIARWCYEAGMDIWVGDSIVAKPRLEPLTTLAYAAAITRRARLGTAVLLPALRQPTVLAHALANLDQLSGGRLVLGLGVGWKLTEIEREWEDKKRNESIQTLLAEIERLIARNDAATALKVADQAVAKYAGVPELEVARARVEKLLQQQKRQEAMAQDTQGIPSASDILYGSICGV